MTRRALTPDPQPDPPLSEAWWESLEESDDAGVEADPSGRIAIRWYLAAAGDSLAGWARMNQEDVSLMFALEKLVGMREQLEHELDTWILYGLENGVSLREMAAALGLTRQGLAKRLKTRDAAGDQA
ncbi:hypothetical protein ACWF0M_12460 [Kribbella sp. NPDC055110]